MFEHFPVENMAYVRLIMMLLLKVQELLIVAILSILSLVSNKNGRVKKLIK